MDITLQLPSKPKVVLEKENQGVYQIDDLYPGYGHTLANSLRRIILSSLPGAAITEISIDGASHEFTTLEGVAEDVVTIILNLKRLRIKMLTDEPQTLTLKAKGAMEVTARDITAPGQVEIMNPELKIATITDKKGSLTIEMRVERGIGYVPREMHHSDKVEIGTIALDAVFSPIKRVNYEVENMRVGDRTDFNRVKIFIETDGTVAPREALEKSIAIMIGQLKAIIGFEEEEVATPVFHTSEPEKVPTEDSKEFLKTRIESLNLSTRTEHALIKANIRTVGGLARKKEDDILNIEGLGDKGLNEIKDALATHDIALKG